MERKSQVILNPQFSSVAQSCPILCDPMNRSTPGLPVHHQLPEFTQTHVHRVGDAMMPSSHFILCRPLFLLNSIPPRIRVFSNESTLRMRWPKYWRFSFSILPLQADSLPFEPRGKPTNHISNAQQPQVVSGYPTEQHRYRIFSALQRVLLVMLL